ncbi:hypothetical protein CYFUS_005620 [Cystobacter fuscus]|uniref:DUF5666 domain-containing protein n=1 Tax=Cystobacter fuscus TaxID=43 RepID=A0A250J9M8_9BACT|nr:hypothetical protein [Cystobacter fuscus]ATB40172.1 hypothetical protein CYFUS_005620 [Cystobacter fuscus]
MRQWMIAAVAVTGLTLTMGAPGVARAQERHSNQGQSMADVQGSGRAGDQRPIEQKQTAFQDGAPSVVMLPTPGRGNDNQGTGGSGMGTGGSGMPSTGTRQEKGIIRSVSDKGMTLSVPKKNRIVTLHVDDQVQLMRDDRPLALSSLQVGDEVRATYQFDEEGQKVLRGLEVTQERAAKEKKKK